MTRAQQLFVGNQKCRACAWWESGGVESGWCRCVGKKTAENAAPCEWMTPSEFAVGELHGSVDFTVSKTVPGVDA